MDRMDELTALRADYEQLHRAAEGVLIQLDLHGELDERAEVFTALRAALYGESD